MPDDAGAEYHRLFVAAKEKRAALESLAGTIKRANDLLNSIVLGRWIDRPDRAQTTGDTPLAFHDQWPTADQIELALREWHEAGRLLTAAYEALAAEAKPSRRPPHEAKIPRTY